MRRLYLCMLLAAMCLPMVLHAADAATLSGKVTHHTDGTPLVGVTLFFPDLNTGTVTDVDGRYSMTDLPMAAVTVQVTYVGHQTIVETVDLRSTHEANFVMRESNAMINEVVVTAFTGTSQLKDSPTPVTVVNARQLHSGAATNVIDALAQQPGVSQMTTGAAISKPVIRGLGYNRVAVVSDGVRQEGQQWGDEHGIEVDADRVTSAQVLKGPASLMYGSDAMAGVLVLNNVPVIAQGALHGNVSTQYHTNNGLIDYSLNIGGNHSVLWDVRYSEQLAHAYKNSVDGYVPGSQFHERALSGIVGLTRSWGNSNLLLNYYHLTPGLVEGERDEVTGELVTEDDYDPKSYHKALPFQQIRHYKAVLDNTFFVGNGNLKFILGYQHNRRQEMEESAHEAELDFRLHTVNYDARYVTTLSDWKLATGVNGMWQRSLNRGEEVLIPQYNLLDIGVFATTTRSWTRWTVSGGLRLDNRHVHSEAFEDIFTRFSRNMTGVTGSVGAVWHATRDLNVRANVSRGFRAPNMSELASNGVHEGSLRYEVGDNKLDPEFSWQVDVGMDYSSPVISAQVALFLNRITGFIYSERLAGVVTDGFDTYRYTSGDARLLGGELALDFHPVEPLHVMNTLSLVDARQLHQPRESRYLPFTPPLRWLCDVRYDVIRDGHTFNNTFVGVGLDCNARQSHCYLAGGTETPTPGYTLFNASAGTDIKVNGRRIATVSIIANNLFNKAYQSHLSRLKYADENIVTGRTGVFNMGRNIAFKLELPLF